MPSTAPQWPTKTRELHNHHFDSTIWNGFVFRDDDIVTATFARGHHTVGDQSVDDHLGTYPRTSPLGRPLV
jgi:hypothetical protein